MDEWREKCCSLSLFCCIAGLYVIVCMNCVLLNSAKHNLYFVFRFKKGLSQVCVWIARDFVMTLTSCFIITVHVIYALFCVRVIMETCSHCYIVKYYCRKFEYNTYIPPNMSTAKEIGLAFWKCLTLVCLLYNKCRLFPRAATNMFDSPAANELEFIPHVCHH